MKMATAPQGTVMEGSTASATVAGADAASPATTSAAATQPLAFDTHSAAASSLAGCTPTACCSDSDERGTDQQKSSVKPAYFSNAYYRQMLVSFSSARWFCPPPELSPFLLARNGFRCTDTGTIDCAVCGEKWTAPRGPHSEIVRTLTCAEETAATADGTAAVSRSSSPLSSPLCSPAVAAASAAGAAVPTTVDEDAETGEAAAVAERRDSKRHKQQRQRQEEEFEQLSTEGRHVVTTEEGGGLSSTGKASSPETREEHKRSTTSSSSSSSTASQVLQEKGKMEIDKDVVKGGNRVLMDAIALSFLHAACCPWRNSFIPLATIHLEGTAVQPAALISQWTNRVQQLRKARASSLPQLAGYPRLKLQAARALLLNALIAAAEATAANQAKAQTPSKASNGSEGQVAAAAKDTTVEAPSVLPLHVLDSCEYEKDASGVKVKKTGSRAEISKAEAAEDLFKEISSSCRCNGESGVAQFLSTPRSPLQPACVSHLSEGEVQLLRKLWLFLATDDGERETLVSKYIPSGMVVGVGIVPPVGGASTLLLEREYELQEGGQQKRNNDEIDEFLSSTLLDTLLQQVIGILFDARVPLPGSVRRKNPLANQKSDDDISSPFLFPKKDEPVHIDCDKLLAFFGWDPVLHCAISKHPHDAAAAATAAAAAVVVADRQQQRPQSDTAILLEESTMLRGAPQQHTRHDVQQPDTTQHPDAPSEHKKRQGEHTQLEVQATSPSSKVGDALRDEGERKLEATPVPEMTVESPKSATVLQCPYCFRCIELQKYASREEETPVISDRTWDLSFTDQAACSQNGDEAESARVGGRQQPIQQRDADGAQAAEGNEKRSNSSIQTKGEQTTRSSNKNNKEEVEKEDVGRTMEETQFSENIISGIGRTTAVIIGGNGGVEQSCYSAGSRYRCTSSNADDQVHVRPDGNCETPKKKDAAVDEVYASPQRTQVDRISSSGGGEMIRKKDLKTTTYRVSAPSIDPVCAHRLHCPFISNAVYKDKPPVVVKLLFSLLPVLVETLQLQAEKRRLDAEINELWGSNKRLQRSQ